MKIWSSFFIPVFSQNLIFEKLDDNLPNDLPDIFKCPWTTVKELKLKLAQINF